ncbi:hypothetical protein [Halomarina litorea]|uniref:hypothetical protein n=1 Tax=Halomarina litorea TaxID=2961595 RepID=UPI0020C2EEBE|nr:hypothetical protein [Halomarina sp. BCD28]
MAHDLVEPTTNQRTLLAEREPTDLITEITTVELPSVVVDVAGEYERVMDDRDRFLWQWIHKLFDAFTLSSVPAADRGHVKEIKTLFTVYITTLDDLIESRRDTSTFDEACRVATAPQTVDPDRPGVDADVLEFVQDVWSRIEVRLKGAPRYDEFRSILQYDIRQGFNAMEYTRLVSDNKHLANGTGARTYGAHNMVLFSYTDIDLMFSPTFDQSDLSGLRDLTWDLQKMARIGNWVTTWERELTEGDYSAGVIVQALQDGIVAPDELDPANQDLDRVAQRIKERGVEEAFLAEWDQRHEEVSNRDYGVDSVDTQRFIEGMETVMEYHLASRGMK